MIVAGGFFFPFIFLPELAECIAESETWPLRALPCFVSVCLHLPCPVCLSPRDLGWPLLGMGCEQSCLELGWTPLLQGGFVGVSPCRPPPSRSSCPCMAGEKGALPGKFSTGICRPSSGACLCVPPPGFVGLLHFFPFSPSLFQSWGCFPWQEQRDSPCCIPILQNQQQQGGHREPQNLEPCQLASPCLWWHPLGLELIFSTLCFVLFRVCGALEEPSAPG